MAQRWRSSSQFIKRNGDGEENLQFDNSGRAELFVPGFDLPVPVERPAGNDERFAHGFGDWAQNRLTAREIAMLRLMNTITDRPQWHLKIRDSSTAAEWAADVSSPLVSKEAWDWILAELRDKAAEYEKTSLIHVLDSSSRICKSDILITSDWCERIAAEVQGLKTQGQIVDPDLFPLVFGKSRVLSDGGRVGVLDAIDRSGQGETCQQQMWRCPRSAQTRCDGFVRSRPDMGTCTRCGSTNDSPQRSWELRGYRFSAQYQWLPCEVSFGATDSPTKGMKITSYINNINPRSNSSLYTSIEKCIELSIQPWNEVLAWLDKGRTPERIRTFGPQWSPKPQEYSQYTSLDDVDENTRKKIMEFLGQPDSPLASSPSRQYPSIDADWQTKYTLREALDYKYHRVKRWLHPEPGRSFTYEDWKLGKNNNAVVPGRRIIKTIADAPRPPKADHEFYTVSIEKDFADKGLQVIVEIGSIELGPDKPTQSATSWQLVGLPNEHVVAATVVYFGTENMTASSGSMSFRVEANLDPADHHWGADTESGPYQPRAPLADIYGFASEWEMASRHNTAGAPALQELGTVLTPDGRLLAFPNTMQHRTEEYRLLDPSRPGRRRFLKLYLVDPHYRICSTRNVPPQQHRWWADAGLSRIPWDKYRMPPELVKYIEDLVRDFPIGDQEADGLREKFRAERHEKQRRTFDEEIARNNFCEWAAQGRAVLW